jgi:cellulose biosynthesis protein BcsQ
LSTAHNAGSPAVARSTLAFLFASLLAVVAIRLLELAPSPYGPAATTVLRVGGPISAIVVVTLVVVGLAGIAAVRGRLRDVASVEEPWLQGSRLPMSRARCPLIGFVGLEPLAGASSIAFNLSVLLATEGRLSSSDRRRHRPRPLCLLSEGPLTEALGLSPAPLREHLATFPGRVTQDVIDLAVRHPSGCELLCVPRAQIGRHQLRLMRDAVEKYYDALIVDSTSSDNMLREGVNDVSDAIVMVALPSAVSEESAMREAERAGAGHRLAVTALVVNRVTANQDLLNHMAAGFENTAQIPDDSSIASIDPHPTPWCLIPQSPAGDQLRLIASHLLPEVFAEDRHAA